MLIYLKSSNPASDDLSNRHTMHFTFNTSTSFNTQNHERRHNTSTIQRRTCNDYL